VIAAEDGPLPKVRVIARGAENAGSPSVKRGKQRLEFTVRGGRRYVIAWETGRAPKVKPPRRRKGKLNGRRG